MRPPDPTTDPYGVLGVTPQADLATIKARYRELAQRYHPDSGLIPDHERMSALNQAWRMVNTVDRRAATDARLARRDHPASSVGSR